MDRLTKPLILGSNELSKPVAFKTENGLFHIVAACHIGGRKENQDRIVLTPEGVVAVIDGMGGTKNGKKAAILAAAALVQHRREKLEDALLAAHQKVRSINDDKSISGAAVTVARFTPNNAEACWMGDTQFIMLRERGRLRRLLSKRWIPRLVRMAPECEISKSHSIAQQLADQGNIRQDEVHDHFYNNSLGKFVGGPEFAPDTFATQFAPGNRMLLSSDGLHKEVNPAVMIELSRKMLLENLMTEVWRLSTEAIDPSENTDNRSFAGVERIAA